MKNDKHQDPFLRWNLLVAQARLDVGPPLNQEVLRARLVSLPAAEAFDWAEEFIARFSLARTLQVCLAGSCACLTLASWQAYETWQALPFAEWMVDLIGGVP